MSYYANYPQCFDMDKPYTTSGPNEFLPGGVPDPKGRKNLNEEYLTQREISEEKMRQYLKDKKDAQEQKHPSEE